MALAGADVVVTDSNLEGAQATADAIVAASGRKAIARHVDVTDEAQIKDAVAWTVSEFGGIDILMHAAGNASLIRFEIVRRAHTTRAR